MAKSDERLITVPDPPEYLSERSKYLWKQVAGRRIRSVSRLLLLEEALSSWDRANECKQKIAGNLTVTTARSGHEHVHPLLKVEKECRQLAVKIFGMLALHIEWS